MTTTTATSAVFWFNSAVTPTPGYYTLVEVTDGGMSFEGVDPELPCDRVELNYESFALYSLEQLDGPEHVNLEVLLFMHQAAADLPEGAACQLVGLLTEVTSSMECPYYLIGRWVERHTERALRIAYSTALLTPRYHELVAYLAPLPE